MNNIFNNDKDWIVIIAITVVIAIIVMLSHVEDWRIDQENFDLCVTKQLNLGAEKSIAERLCEEILNNGH